VPKQSQSNHKATWTKAAPHLSLSEDDLRRKGLNSVPDDLFDEPEASGVPDITGVTQFVRGPHPLSPAETGHYHYNRRWPGMNGESFPVLSC